MSWILTALKQIVMALFLPHNDTIEISNRLFDEVTPVFRRRRGARRKILNQRKRPPRREQ